MLRSALASFFTSAVLAASGAHAGDGPPDAAYAASREFEAQLAKQPAIYLVLDPQRRVLEVRARGTTLDRVELRGIELVSQQSVFRPSLPASPVVPALWRVRTGPGDTDREVIAPDSLRPMPKDDEEETAAPAGGAAAPTPTATPIPEPPTAYRAQLENGWDLWVTESLPPQGRLHVLVAALRDGWARLRGDVVDRPPAIALAMRGEDAKRVHHLLRSGMAILVTASAS